MLRFPHGIRRAFLRPVWAPFQRCLPLLALLHGCPKDGEGEHLQKNQPIQIGEEGDLLPQIGDIEDPNPAIKGHEDEDVAEFSLQPDSGHKLEHMGLLPPIARGADESAEGSDKGILKSTQRGEDEGAVNSMHMQKEGHFTPTNAIQNYEGNLQPTTNNNDEDSMLLSIFGAPYPGDFFPHLVSYLEIDVLHDWKHCIFVTSLNAWLMPSPRPRVKMKENLQPLDIHAWKHDAWISTSSTSTFPINATLSNEDEGASYEVTQAITMPFTPLRGRKGYQGHESQFKLKMMACSGSKTKMMQMRLFYLMKDVIDPG